MRILGIYNKTPVKSDFIHSYLSRSEITNQHNDFDYIIDVDNIKLLEDPSLWFDSAGIYYSDFISPNGTYKIHSHFPSLLNEYPGLIVRKDIFQQFGIDDLLNKTWGKTIVRYIPKPIIRVVV
jgi:hypothetical protein